MGIIKYRYAFQARAWLLEKTYYMMERVNLLLRDFTIDYEEYFNRKNVGCDSGYQNNFQWNVWLNWYCDNYTAYWNYNTLFSNTGEHHLYSCSSLTWYILWNQYVAQNLTLSEWSWCFISGHQSYGEYTFQFIDMKADADFAVWVIWDGDDVDYGKWPNAIQDATWVQELYLISQSKKDRVFIRRILVESGDWNGDGVITWDNEYRYTLQMLKLKGFDAGNNHSFNPLTTSGVYDWTTDTWACDYSQWFICNWSWIGNVYSWYRLPIDQNDGWVNIFDRNVTVINRNIVVYPTKDPEYAWAEDMVQINPYFTVSLKTKLYWWVWQKRLHESINNFQFTLQTTFNTKNNYIKK